jgi:hypothetical protein
MKNKYQHTQKRHYFPVPLIYIERTFAFIITIKTLFDSLDVKLLYSFTLFIRSDVNFGIRLFIYVLFIGNQLIVLLTLFVLVHIDGFLICAKGWYYIESSIFFL